MSLAQDDAWTDAARPDDSHPYGSVVPLKDGRVLLFGGGSQLTVGDFNHPNPEYLVAELYDPATDTWTRAARMPGLALGPRALAIPDGRVVAFGVGNGSPPHRPAVYDPKRDSWRRGRLMSRPREVAAVTLLNDGRLLVAGGFLMNGRASRDVEIYDPVRDTWNRAAPLKAARIGAAAATLADGRVIVTGGSVGLTKPPYSRPITRAELYDPATNSWSPAGEPPVGQPGGILTPALLLPLPDGRVMAFGSLADGGVAPAIFDPTTMSWSLTAPWQTARIQAMETVLPDGRVLVAGGMVPSSSVDCTVVAGTEIYDPGTDYWSVGPPTHSGRASAHMVNLSDGRIMLIGGIHPLVPDLCGGYAASGASGASEILDPGLVAVQP